MEIPFINCSQKKFMQERVRPLLENDEKCFIVTANPEIVMETRRNNTYKKFVQSANYVVPDGIGILLAAKRKKEPLYERIAGFDLMNDLLQVAEKENFSCFFLGASAEVNEQAVKEIKKKHPKLKVAGAHHGYFDVNDTSVMEQVKETNPDIVFVALGFPKQEEWIARHSSNFSKGVFIGVGGSFDVFAGNVKRAPEIWIKCNLEWLYRLLKQPFRIKRMLPIIQFMWLILIGRG